MTLSPTKYHVMRTDESGNLYFVSCWDSPAGATFESIRLNGSGHKQSYDVQPTTVCNHAILQTPGR